MKRWTRVDWIIILGFAALVALFFWRILTPNPADRQSFPPGDFYDQFWAFTTFEARELSAGRLPLWNPYTFAGAPFWADVQSAVLYPFSLLALALSAPWGFSAFALELEAIFHFWLAALFMYLFARDVTGSRPAGAIAALVWAFGGYLTGYPSQQLAVLEVDVWLPLILFFIYHTFAAASSGQKTSTFIPQPSALILAGTAFGIALLAGHPQSYLIVGYISSAYLLFLSWDTQSRSAAESQSRKAAELNPQNSKLKTLQLSAFSLRLSALFAPLLIFLLIALGLAAIQFIPAAEYTLHSVRAEGAYAKMSGGFPLIDLIQLLLPGQVSVYSPLYVSVMGLLLAGWGALTAPTRQTVFWALVAGLALLISLGGNTFLYSPLYLSAPGFSIFRGQERWALAVAFSLSLLAGYGFKQLSITNDQLSKKPLSVNRDLSSLLKITRYLLLLAVLLTLAFFFGLTNTGWTPASPFYGLLGAATRLTLVAALAGLVWLLVPRLPGGVLALLVGGLICFDLFSVNWQTNLYPQPPEWHTRMPAAVEAIKTDAAGSPGEPFRVYNEFRLYDNYGVPFELEDLWGASPLRPARYDQFLAPPMPIERTWELLNVKYVITWRQELFVPSTIIYQEAAADGATYAHRLNSVGPRAWLVDHVEIATDAASLQKMADPNFDRWSIALLEERVSESANLRIDELTNDAPADDATRNSQHVSLVTRHSSLVTYQISTPAPALLLLSEPDYPGWQATVDGQPAPVLRADYVLRAVPVPAGEHTVELRFRPLSFTVGAVVSGVTLAAISLLLIIFAVRGRSREPAVS